MRRFLSFLTALLAGLGLAWSSGHAQSVVKTENVRAELISEVAAVKPGEPFWVALRQTIRPKWHTYWKNPGDSGLPTEIKWTLPTGTAADAIVWPTPTLIDVGGIINYGFSNDVLLLMRITPSADLLVGSTLPLAALAEWLVCDDVCIPEEGKFTLDLPVAAAAQPANAETRALFSKARRDVPTASPWSARFALAPNGDPVLVIDAKGLKPETIRDVYFFPAEWGPVAHMARQSARVSADGIRIPLKKGEAAGGKESGKGAAAPQQLIGTLALTEKTADGEHRQAFDLTARFDPAASALADSGAGEASLSLVEALLFALLGGLILNFMPCVFPVLAMKAASFARLAGHSRADLRRDGVAYTSGVLVSFATMAVALLAIRGSVGDVSWGIQFQSPIFSLLIAYLFFAVGLNLSGVFEVGGRFAGIGQSLAARGGTLGAFFTGVLAVLVATPCTAPFMAAALGFALVQPAPQTVGVLLAMGVGLALPYLVLTLTPALQRFLPRPGPWMDRLRQLLAFPMYASAVWMIWVLTQQTGADGVLYALGGMVLIAFAAWLVRVGGPSSAVLWLRRGAAAVAVLLAFAVTLKLENPSATAASASGGPVTGVNFEGWERYSHVAVEQARPAGKPVFVDLTAAWCITCLVNERVALETAATKQAFERTGTVKLKGDWTNKDPEISALLKEVGRAGVPVYLYWAPGAQTPKILPQILTESLVISEISQPGRSACKGDARC